MPAKKSKPKAKPEPETAEKKDKVLHGEYEEDWDLVEHYLEEGWTFLALKMALKERYGNDFGGVRERINDYKTAHGLD